jgi:hypothetical protein
LFWLMVPTPKNGVSKNPASKAPITPTTISPFAPSGPNYLHFKRPVESRPQSQPLEAIFL